MRLNMERGWGSLCWVLTHTHCRLVVLLEDLGNIAGLLLLLPDVVLTQRRPVCSSTANLPRQRMWRRWSHHSPFAIGCPAARSPARGTGLTGDLRATVWTQMVQTQVHVIQAVASRQAVPSLQSGEEFTTARRVGLWGTLQENRWKLKQCDAWNF